MLLHDGSRLTKEQIEELNANGPYSMAVWTSGDTSQIVRTDELWLRS